MWGVDATRTTWLVMQMSPLTVVKGKERVQLTNGLKRYWDTYHAKVIVDPAPLTISGHPAVSFSAVAEGRFAEGVTVSKGQKTYLAFYKDDTSSFDMEEALAFERSFTLT